MEFTVTITDQAQLDGITWAREQHNIEAQELIDTGNHSMPLTPTDQDYVQWVMERAAASYAQQKQAAEG